MHACRTVPNVLGDDFLDGSSDGDFMRRVVDRTKATPNARGRYGFGTQWNSYDREHKASQQARDHSSGRH
jgi:hypothetical protein